MDLFYNNDLFNYLIISLVNVENLTIEANNTLSVDIMVPEKEGYKSVLCLYSKDNFGSKIVCLNCAMYISDYNDEYRQSTVTLYNLDSKTIIGFIARFYILYLLV